MQRTLLVFLALVCLPRLAFAAVIIGEVLEQETRLPVSGARVALTFLESERPVVIAVSHERTSVIENSGSGGAVSGDWKGRHTVGTVTINGVTTRHSFVDATELALSIRQAGLAGLRVVVPSTRRRYFGVGLIGSFLFLCNIRLNAASSVASV